jgi:hypothetical protein
MSFNARFHLPSPLENDGHPLARLLRGQDDRRWIGDGEWIQSGPSDGISGHAAPRRIRVIYREWETYHDISW